MSDTPPRSDHEAPADSTIPEPPKWPVFDAARGPATEPRSAASLLEWARTEVGDRYRVTRAAGAGGHSLVFEGFDLRLERPVAIKFLRGSVEPGAPRPLADLDRALLDEARAMARLRHEGLCPVYEVEGGGSTPFLVMEWIDGVTLDEAWSGTCRDHQITLYMRVVDAVAALHAAGMVHGDIKPSNVVVDRRGRPVVVDFGLAIRAGGARGRAFGTPGFAAPEQLDARASITAASDVFSLGALLYLLLTGERAINDSTIEACRARALAVDYRLPQERAPDTPASLQRICLTALEPVPKDRYQDAGAMMLDLQRSKRGEEVVARPRVLETRFFDQVDTTMAHVERWRRQSLVTDREATSLDDLLRRIRRPDSSWLVDARRLIPSQVALYFGGWIALTAMTAGLWMAWDAFDQTPWMRWGIPTLTALLLGGAGIWLLRRRETRIALGFFVVVDLAIAVSTVQMLRETGWLAPAAQSVPELEWRDQLPQAPATELVASFARTLDLGTPTLGEAMGGWNVQLVIASMAWLVASALLGRLCRASALTPMASLAGLILWMSAWAAAGMFDASSAGSKALFGAWLMAGGVPALALALRRHRWEESFDSDAGEGVSLPRDAWSIACVALVATIVGLAVAAWFAPEVFTLGLLSDATLTTRRAAAFIVASLPLMGLATLLQRRRTPLRARLATGVRLLAPSWVLVPMLVLERDCDDAWWPLWQGVFFAAVVVVAALSALRNWKPFLVSSLVYFLMGYVNLVHRLASEFSMNSASVAQIAMFVTLVIGLLAMGVAYVGPRIRSAMRA